MPPPKNFPLATATSAMRASTGAPSSTVILHILEAVADELDHGAPEEQRLGRHLALALVGIDRAVGGARQAEAGDVDEMAAGQRAMVVDVADAPGIDLAAPWPRRSASAPHRPRRGRPSPRAKSMPVPQGSRPSSVVRPLSWNACSSPSATSLAVPSPPAAITRSKPLAREVERQPFGVALGLRLAQFEIAEMLFQRRGDLRPMPFQPAATGNRIENHPDLQAHPPPRTSSRCGPSPLPALKPAPAGGARAAMVRTMPAGCHGAIGKSLAAERSPIIPLSTGPRPFPKPLTRRTVEPISGGYRSPRRKAKRNGGFPEARTARCESRLACSRDGCRDLRGRGKRANADGGPMLP